MGASPRATLLALALFAAAVGLTQSFALRDGDTFWNIRAGLVLLERGSLPAHDVLSHTAGDRPWIHHEWGAQLLWAGAYELGGWAGVRGLRALLVVALLALWLVLGRRILRPRGAGWGLTLAAVAAGWVALMPHVSARPRLLGWVLYALACWLFFAAAGRWGWRRYAAFFLFAVGWFNVHSSALLLPLTAGLELASALVCKVSARLRSRETRPWRDLAPAALRTALASIALLLQPAGFALVGYILETPKLNREYSSEWWPLWRADVWQQHPAIIVVAALLASITLLSIMARWRRGGSPASEAGTTFPSPLTALAFVALAFYSRRMTAQLIIVALFAARELWRWPTLRARVESLASRLRRLSTVALALGTLALSASSLPQGAPLAPPHLEPGRFPVAAAQLVRRAHLEGKLFNFDGWGGYLGHVLYPQHRVFLDGRWIVVGRRVFLDHLAVLLRRDADAILERYGVELVMQPTSMYFRTPALSSAVWGLAYRDRTAVLLWRRGGQRGAANLQRLCAFYRRRPDLWPHARWPGRLLGGHAGQATPTDLPTAWRLCRRGP